MNDLLLKNIFYKGVGNGKEQEQQDNEELDKCSRNTIALWKSKGDYFMITSKLTSGTYGESSAYEPNRDLRDLPPGYPGFYPSVCAQKSKTKLIGRVFPPFYNVQND